MTVVAELVAIIGADISGFTKGLDTVRSGLNNAVKNLGPGLSDLGRSLSVLTAPLALFGATGIKVASDFDSAMAEIAARTGATGAEMEQIRQLALKMGADTAFSAQDAAGGFLQLLSSGQTLKESIVTLPAIFDAAAASGSDLGKTADNVTDVMAAFGLPVSAAKDVVDSFARAAGATSATMDSLFDGFANIGPVAKAFGLTVDDTNAILGVFSENGVKGAEAGTALRSMLTHMSSGTKEVNGAWKRLGLSMFDANGKMRPIGPLMEDIRKAMAGMTQEARIDILHDLAGSYGQVGLAALTGSVSIGDIRKRMRESAGAADVAAKRMDTFAGRVESLRGSIESLQINALTPLMNNAFKPLVEQMTSVVNAISEWITKNPVLAETIAKVLTAVAVAGPALFIVGQVISALGSALAVLTGPIGLVIAAVALLGMAWAENWGGIRDIVMPIIERISSAFKVFTAQLGAFIKNVKNFGLSTALTWALNLGDGKKYLSGWIQGVLEALGVGKEQAGAAVTGINNILQGLISAFGSVASTLGSILSPLTTLISNFFLTLFSPGTLPFGERLEWAIHNAIGYLPGAIGQLMANIGQFIVNNAPLVATAFGNLLGKIGGWISTNVNNVLNGFGTLFEDIATWVGKGGLDKLIGGLGKLISGAAEWFSTKAWPALQEGVKSLFGSAQGWIAGSDGLKHFVDGFGKLIASVGKWIAESAWPAIQSFFKTFFDSIGKWVADGENGGGAALVKGIGDAVIALGNWVSLHGWETVLSFFTSFVDEMGKFIKDTSIDKFIDGIGQGIRDAATWIEKKGWPLLRDAFGQIFKWIGEQLAGIGTAFIDSVMNIINEIRGVSSDIKSGMNPGMVGGFTSRSDIQGGLQSWGDLFQGFANAAGFAGGGPTGGGASGSVAGLVHTNEWVVPQNGALVLRGDGGYSGPSIVRVQLMLDKVMDEIDVHLAGATG